MLNADIFAVVIRNVLACSLLIVKPVLDVFVDVERRKAWCPVKEVMQSSFLLASLSR